MSAELERRGACATGRAALLRVIVAGFVALAALFVASGRADADAPAASSAPSAPSAAPTSAVPPPTRRAPLVALTPSDDARRATPRRVLTGFLRASEAGDYAKASEFLDLRGVPRGKDQREATDLAKMLYSVLVWRVALDPNALPDEPDPEGVGSDGIVLDAIDLDGEPRTLALTRVRLATGQSVWLFSRETVASIRPIYEASERRGLEERVPEWLKGSPWGGLRPWQWIGLLVLAVASYAFAWILSVVAIAIGVRTLSRFSKALHGLGLGLRRPVRLGLSAAVFQGAVPYLLLPASFRAAVEWGPTTLYVVAAAWGAIALVSATTTTWEGRLPVDTAGDLMSRGTRTRLAMLRQLANVVIVIVAGGVILMQFAVVRNVGVSLLASAGIASVVVGFAAQRSLGGIIAGIELSITQPLRIGDVVVFRTGEVGKVEHIYFTYVVIQLFDDRRLIVPVTRVLADPFENWTRTGGRLLAPVELWVDLAAPVQAFRVAFERLCKASKLWDGRRSTVHVTEVTDRAMLLRGVASVADVSRAFDLRCELREGWLAFMRELEDGRFMPQGRVGTVPPKPDPGEPAQPGPAQPGPAQPGTTQREPSKVSSGSSASATRVSESTPKGEPE